VVGWNEVDLGVGIVSQRYHFRMVDKNLVREQRPSLSLSVAARPGIRPRTRGRTCMLLASSCAKANRETQETKHLSLRPSITRKKEKHQILPDRNSQRSRSLAFALSFQVRIPLSLSLQKPIPKQPLHQLLMPRLLVEALHHDALLLRHARGVPACAPRCHHALCFGEHAGC
jgi:hypothetical protein